MVSILKRDQTLEKCSLIPFKPPQLVAHSNRNHKLRIQHSKSITSIIHNEIIIDRKIACHGRLESSWDLPHPKKILTFKFCIVGGGRSKQPRSSFCHIYVIVLLYSHPKMIQTSCNYVMSFGSDSKPNAFGWSHLLFPPCNST